MLRVQVCCEVQHCCEPSDGEVHKLCVLQQVATPLVSRRHTCVAGLFLVWQHVPLQLTKLGKQHRSWLAGGPVKELSVQNCTGFAPIPVLQHSRPPQHDCSALQQLFCCNPSPHIFAAPQHDCICSTKTRGTAASQQPESHFTKRIASRLAHSTGRASFCDSSFLSKDCPDSWRH